MKYKSKTYSTKDAKYFALEVFDYLNGKINKKVPARRIEFFKDRDVEFGFDNSSSPEITSAVVHANTVKFDPNAIIDMDRLSRINLGKSMTYEQFTGLIIQIIAHELSHLDQDIDQIKFCEDEDYQYFIEITNELRTLKWIKSHYRKMIKIFDVKFDYKWAFDKSAYLKINDVNGLGYKASDYIAVPDIHTKLFNDMNVIFSCDMVGILQEAIEKGVVDLQISYVREKDLAKGKDNPDIIDLGKIDVLLTDDARAYSVLEILNRLMISSYKKFVVEIITDGSNLVLDIIERKEGMPFNLVTPTSFVCIKSDRPQDAWISKYSSATSLKHLKKKK